MKCCDRGEELTWVSHDPVGFTGIMAVAEVRCCSGLHVVRYAADRTKAKSVLEVPK